MIYTAVVFFLGGLIIPGVSLDGMGTALRSAITFSIWQVLLLVPTVLVSALLIADSPSEFMQSWLSIGLVAAVNWLALERTERSNFDLKVTNAFARLALLGLFTLLGVGLRFGA